MRLWQSTDTAFSIKNRVFSELGEFLPDTFQGFRPSVVVMIMGALEKKETHEQTVLQKPAGSVGR